LWPYRPFSWRLGLFKGFVGKLLSFKGETKKALVNSKMLRYFGGESPHNIKGRKGLQLQRGGGRITKIGDRRGSFKRTFEAPQGRFLKKRT